VHEEEEDTCRCRGCPCVPLPPPHHMTHMYPPPHW
jgi:hypothetical protein